MFTHPVLKLMVSLGVSWDTVYRIIRRDWSFIRAPLKFNTMNFKADFWTLLHGFLQTMERATNRRDESGSSAIMMASKLIRNCAHMICKRNPPLWPSPYWLTQILESDRNEQRPKCVFMLARARSTWLWSHVQRLFFGLPCRMCRCPSSIISSLRFSVACGCAFHQF